MTTTRNYSRDHEKASELQTLDARDVRALEEEITVMQHVGEARGDNDLFLVVSASGSEYLVDVRAGTCTCPDFVHNGNHCKHARRVTMETGMRPVDAVALDALDVSDQFDGDHVDGEPRIVADRCGAKTRDGGWCDHAAGSCPHHESPALALATAGGER